MQPDMEAWRARVAEERLRGTQDLRWCGETFKGRVVPVATVDPTTHSSPRAPSLQRDRCEQRARASSLQWGGAQDDLKTVQERHLDSLKTHSRRCRCPVRGLDGGQIGQPGRLQHSGAGMQVALRCQSQSHEVTWTREDRRMGAQMGWQAFGEVGRTVGVGLRPQPVT